MVPPGSRLLCVGRTHAGGCCAPLTQGASPSPRLSFQDSLSFMYQTLERNLRTLFTGSSQRPRKHVASPLASYFLSCPYARLGWWVRVSGSVSLSLSLSLDR